MQNIHHKTIWNTMKLNTFCVSIRSAVDLAVPSLLWSRLESLALCLCSFLSPNDITSYPFLIELWQKWHIESAPALPLAPTTAIHTRLKINQWTVTYFERGITTVQLTSCLNGLDLTKQVNLFKIQHYQSSWIQINKTEGQPYSDDSRYKVSEYSLVYLKASVDGSCRIHQWCKSPE